KSSLGGLSAWQMQEDLKQLAALASGTSGGAGAAAGGAGQGPEAVDALARWLLGQADLQSMA
ncbi:MAG TPA: hypothetical protein VFV33_26195, partial [Gemmatimonadaceae bacterium]|nr:hypothetical protein [Gemmatimonadaceae bacterium]